MVNLKVYVGQTSNIKSRFNSHLYELRHGTHGNKHLQFAFNKYTESNFSFIVLEACYNLDEKETRWINFFNSANSKYGYNKNFGGGNRTVTDETRRKISAWQKGRKLTKEHVQNIINSNKGRKMKPEVKEYLSNLYTGRPLTKETKDKISLSKKGKKMSEEQKARRIGMGEKPVIQYNLDGCLIREFTSAKKAGQLLGFWKSDITQCCLGNRKTVRGYIFKYKNDENRNKK